MNKSQLMGFSITISALAFAPMGPNELIAGESFRAGPGQVALIELYTSEGCSSCPPAEEWLSALQDRAGLWREFVPVVFHVSYWDHLGWKDPSSSKEFTARQTAQAKEWGSSSVYTPCFVRNGREWKPGHDTLGAGAPVGVLSLERTEPHRWRIEFHPEAALQSGQIEAHVALLAGGLTSDVRAGENAGRRLAHDFVVYAVKDVALTIDDRGQLAAELELEAGPPASAPRRAIAAWVTPAGEMKPVQAVGGWLP
jgi:hypothetical protein